MSLLIPSARDVMQTKGVHSSVQTTWLILMCWKRMLCCILINLCLHHHDYQAAGVTVPGACLLQSLLCLVLEFCSVWVMWMSWTYPSYLLVTSFVHLWIMTLLCRVSWWCHWTLLKVSNTSIASPAASLHKAFYFFFSSLFCHLSNARVNQYLQSFIPYTGKLWNSLPLSVFPPAYDLNYFKREVSRHL